ncbi:uncharacterized protein LOC142336618 [Convolutriloba macropyga]|uniref:uncharacterized protein LOC142336618 n=1 Tax=Convolutriloba macropyga TaxID=536237 RepID=UPI003F529109
MAYINWSEVNEVLRKACNQLSSTNLTRVREGAAIVRKMYNDMKADPDRKLFSDKLAQLRFVDSAKAILTNCEVLNQPLEKATEIVDLILGLILSLSNNSVSICEQGGSNVGNFDREIMGDRMRRCLGILHNIIQLFPDARFQIHTAELQELLIQLVQLTEGTLKICAIMTLCVVVDSQNNANILKVSKPDIEILLMKVLMKAIDDTAMNNMMNQLMPGLVEVLHMFSADEVFQCLSILASNRDNALEMIKQGVISQCEAYLDFSSQRTFVQSSDLSHHSVNKATKWALSLLRRLKSSFPEMIVFLTF